MRFTSLFIVAVASAAFLTGCTTSRVETLPCAQPQPIAQPPVTPAPSDVPPTEHKVGQPVEPIKFFSAVAPARIPIQVTSRNNASGFTGINRVIEGNIANAGYELTDQKPYLTIAIENGKVVNYDKLGNSYVIKAKVELTIHRNVYDYLRTVAGRPHLLAREIIKAKGKRKFDRDEAVDSAAGKLAADSTIWAQGVFNRELKGLTAVRVRFPVRSLKKAFRGLGRGSYERCLTLMLKKVAAKKSIFYFCIVQRDNTDITFETVYRKRDYPNGPFASFANLNIHFKGKTPQERVNEFLSYVMR